MDEGSQYSGRSRSRRGPHVWHLLQVFGVCTCMVGFRLFNTFPSKVLNYSGAFFIPYYAGMLLIVLPVLYVQLKLGGATRSNIVALFGRYIPILKGIGIACVLRMFIFNIYFNVIVSYLAYFAANSLISPFPWSTCGNTWNDDTCTNSSSAILNGVGLPEQQYFDNHVLELSTDISLEGSIRWMLAVSLAGVWGLTFIMVAPGVRVFGWLTAIFGNLALIIGVALMAYAREELPHNNPETIVYSMDLEKLHAPNAVTAFLSVWMEGMFEGVAVTHLWQGVLPTVGKYACHGSSCRLNGFWVVIFMFVCAVPHLVVNLLANFLNPLVALSGSSLQSMFESGPRMLFVLFPAALHQLGLGRGVAFVFFLMVGLLLANTQALFCLVAVENIGDFVKSAGRCCSYRISRNLFITALYCAAGLLLGAPMITQGGYYFVQLIAQWLDKLLCIIVFLSMICFTESYTKQRFSLCHRVTMLIWFLLASLFTTAISVYTAKLQEEPTPTVAKVRNGLTYTYPDWSYIIGWLTAGGPIVLGLIYGIIHTCMQTGRSKLGCLTACTGRMDEDEEYLQSASSTLKRRSAHSDGSEYVKPRY